MSARVTAVCLPHHPRPEPDNPSGSTAIDRRPVAGAVPVGPLGLVGDWVGDLANHGGPDKALYVFADEDAAAWAVELRRDVPPGSFGENLRTSGIDVSGALVGERWLLGAELLVEITQPRTPCMTFQRWMNRSGWVREFTRRGTPGGYLRVLRPGSVQAGDPLDVLHRPAHGVSIGGWIRRSDPGDAVRLLQAERAGELVLAQSLREYARRRAAQA